eukprot:jgi/Chrzof1/2879/Cz12g02170.t1
MRTLDSIIGARRLGARRLYSDKHAHASKSTSAPDDMGLNPTTSNTCRQGCSCVTTHKQALQGEGRRSSELMPECTSPF